ncbi:MAG: glycosyltransferase family 2 protein [Verrucomicrobiales bacterium]|nr:glycosyltransferase family 2 protein [Verrucomicrobiales bacterium]
MPRVSILLPVRNAEGTLERAVNSCLEQSFTDIELIIVDDGSTDGSTEIAGMFSRMDSRVVRIALGEHRGVAVAAEVGRRAASGELIARMDADDVCRPRRIARQVEVLDQQGHLAGCGTGVRLIGAPQSDPGRGFAEHVRWVNSLSSPEQLAAERFIDSPLVNPSSMVRADVLESAGGFSDPEWAEDYDLWLRLLEEGHQFLNIQQALLDWHDSGNRLTRASLRYSADMFSRAKAHYLARVPEVAKSGVEIAGAGPVGKRLARHLAENSVPIGCFYEVSPRRLGERIAGIEVRDHSTMRCGESVLLAAVGLPGARARIRKLALAAGYREGLDFFCVA